MENHVSYEQLESTFNQYGQLVDVVMPARRSYAYVIYQDPLSSLDAISHLQAQVVTVNQTPVCFYLFPVDRGTTNCCCISFVDVDVWFLLFLFQVPDSSRTTHDNDSSEYEQVSALPNGLVYKENFIDSSYADEIVSFVTMESDDGTGGSGQPSSPSKAADLKKRRVKHYGYEFRYGTNDFDPARQLAARLPPIFDRLLNKLVDENLLTSDTWPDQLTVNIYEPGQGIAPHVDNPNAFDDYVISVSLMSDLSMVFRQQHKKKMSQLCLRANSVLVLRGESRFEWSHAIAERKHDLMTDLDGHVRVNVRSKRVSLTFRKTKTAASENETASENALPKLVLPSDESEACAFERSHVHDVYNQIAEHFSQTRHSPWPGVAKFIHTMPAGSLMLDVGCGNGKYLGLRSDLICVGLSAFDYLSMCLLIVS